MKPILAATTCILVMLSLPVASEDQGQTQAGFRPVSQQVTVELHEDGQFRQTAVMAAENISGGPLAHYTCFGSWMPLESVFDGDGHALDYTVRKEGDGYRVRVTLRQPAEPGERIRLRLVDRKGEVHLGRNGVYAYGKHHWPGVDIGYEEKIIVNPGLRLLFCEPEPEQESVEDGKAVVVYRRHLRPDEAFKCRILYQADKSGGSEGERKAAPD